jgi:hypothetical protein
MISIDNPVIPFPANESHGMQQAWRLMHHDPSLGLDSLYTINRDYRPELRELRGRYYVAIGSNTKVRPLTPPQQSYLDKLLDKLNDPIHKFINSYTKLATATACVCAAGFIGGTTFVFFQYPFI